MNQPLNPKALADELVVRHAETSDMLSEVDFWSLELNFFDRLLHQQSVNTGSEYGDRLAENLFTQLNDLHKELAAVQNALTEHRKSEEKLLNESSAENRDTYIREHKECSGMVLRFGKQFKSYKRTLFDFAEHYGNPGTSAKD